MKPSSGIKVWSPRVTEGQVTGADDKEDHDDDDDDDDDDDCGNERKALSHSAYAGLRYKSMIVSLRVRLPETNETATELPAPEAWQETVPCFVYPTETLLKMDAFGLSGCPRFLDAPT